MFLSPRGIAHLTTELLHVGALETTVFALGWVSVNMFHCPFILGLRFIFLYVNDIGEGNIQSLILSAVLLITGFNTIVVSFLMDLIASNRKLIEETTYKINKILNRK